jgi:hypothetical protein
VAAVAVAERGEEEVEHLEQPGLERRIARVGLDVVADRWIAPVAVLQTRFPVRVPEKPAVEDQIGPRREPATVGKGRDRDRQLRTAAGREKPLHLLAQIVGRHVRRVDQDGGAPPQRAEQVKLPRDAVGRVVVRGQRVTAAGFGIAPLKRHRLAIEIKQVGLDSLGRGKTFILRDKPLGGEIPVPRIGA